MTVTATNDLPFETGKTWVKVELHNSRVWIPSFEDLHRIIQAISYCEDEKYPPEKGYKGRRFVEDFLRDAVYEKDYKKLAEKYKIPVRCKNIVVKTNGADLEQTKNNGRDNGR